MAENNANNQLLGNTAFWTAAVRALESESAGRLLLDPWALPVLLPDMPHNWYITAQKEQVLL